MEHAVPSENFQRENGTTFSEVPLFPEIFQWNKPKNHVPFTTRPEFSESFGKWKTPTVSKTKLDETKTKEGVKSLLYEARINHSHDHQAEEKLKKTLQGINPQLGLSLMTTENVSPAFV